MSRVLIDNDGVKDIYLEVIYQLPENERKVFCEKLMAVVQQDMNPEITPYQLDEIQQAGVDWRTKVATIKFAALEEIYKTI